MENLTNDEILIKVDNLIKEVKNLNEYKNYIKLKEEISKNEEINNLITEIKKLNKEITKLSTLKENTINKEAYYQKLLDQLENIPLYKQYTYAKEDLNNILLIIKNNIDNYIKKLTNG